MCLCETQGSLIRQTHPEMNPIWTFLLCKARNSVVIHSFFLEKQEKMLLFEGAFRTLSFR